MMTKTLYSLKSLHFIIISRFVALKNLLLPPYFCKLVLSVNHVFDKNVNCQDMIMITDSMGFFLPVP